MSKEEGKEEHLSVRLVGKLGFYREESKRLMGKFAFYVEETMKLIWKVKKKK